MFKLGSATPLDLFHSIEQDCRKKNMMHTLVAKHVAEKPNHLKTNISLFNQ
jgi:hypothetical protein